MIASACGIAASMLTSGSAAFAHGGMAGPDELGQPLAISAAIAFLCYWAVVLWPSRKRNDRVQTNQRKPNRKRNRIASSNGDGRAVTLKAVGRGSDG